MDISLDWKNIFYLFAQFIGFLVGLLLVVSGLRNRKNNTLLGLNFIFLTYSSFIIWLITTGYFVKFPHLYRTGYLTGLIFIPLMFLYIKHEIQEKPISWLSIFHFLPALVYIIDFWPVFNLNADQKLSLITAEIKNPALFTQFSQSRFFNANFYTPFRSILNAVYWAISVYWVTKGLKNKIKHDFAKTWFIWIKIFLALQSMVFLPALLLYWAIEPLTAYLLTHISVVLLNLITAFALLLLPKILYGLDAKDYEIKQSANTRKSKTEILDQLSAQKIEEIRISIFNVLESQKKFLQQGYSINDLSKDTNIPSYLLTMYINKTLATTFPELINKARIEECCKMMASGEYAHFATEGFAQLCGFSNRNTFTLAFRKYKGITPAAYFKNLVK